LNRGKALVHFILAIKVNRAEGLCCPGNAFHLFKV
jgi:hypothetical protein